MTVKNIIKNACVFLSKDELLNLTDLGGENQATDEQTKDLNHLVRCLNLVYNEIATDYIPLLNKETFLPDNGRIYFEDFSKKLLEIYRIEDKFGYKTNYKLYPNFLETIDGEVKITYSFEPEAIVSLDSVIESFSEKITERVIAYGVAMEYSFICGLHDDAAIWEKRFKDGILIAARKKSEIRLPARRWNWWFMKKNFF